MIQLSVTEEKLLDEIEDGWDNDGSDEAMDRTIDKLHREATHMRREVFREALRRIGAL